MEYMCQILHSKKCSGLWENTSQSVLEIAFSFARGLNFHGILLESVNMF